MLKQIFYLLFLFLFLFPTFIYSQIDTTSSDMDGDGVPNALDIDWDNDGIPNEMEYCFTTDGIIKTKEGFDSITIEQSGDISVYKGDDYLDYVGRFVFNEGGALDGNLVLGPFTSGDLITFNAVFSKDYAQSAAGGHVKAKIELLDAAFESMDTVFWEENNAVERGAYNEKNIRFKKSFKGDVYLKISDNGSTGQGLGNIWSFVRIGYSGLNACDNDSDGYPNHVDIDSDGDNCLDLFEGGAGTHTAESIEEDTAFVGFGVNGLADHIEDSIDMGGISYELNPVYLDSAVDLCKDSDKDGIINIYDIDDDNDGVPDSLEKYVSEDYLSNIIDGSFENLQPHPFIPSIGTVTGGGWFNGSGSCDSHFFIGDQYEGAYGKQSPNGGTFVGCWGRRTAMNESFYINIPGLQVGKKYSVGFYQGITDVSDSEGEVKGRWRIVFGDESKESELMSLYDKSDFNGDPRWTWQELVFTATKPTQILEFFGGSDPLSEEDFYTYCLIDGLRITDYVESENGEDYDGDGIINREDLDSDNDGCPDRMEAGVWPDPLVDTMPGPYGINGLANSVETPNDGGDLLYDLTYDFAVDSVNNLCDECYSCSSCDKSACPKQITGYLSEVCPSGLSGSLSNIPISVLDSSKNVIEQTTTDSTGYYRLYVRSGKYYIQLGDSSQVPIAKVALNDISGNHINRNYYSDLLTVSTSDIRVNGILQAIEVKPIIDSLPNRLPTTCLPDISNIHPIISNTTGTISLDSTVYKTGVILDSIWYFWTATSDCGFSSTDSLRFVPLELSFDLQADTLYACAYELGTTLSVELTQGEAPFEYEWSSAVGEVMNADSSEALFVHNQVGEYPVRIFVKNEAGCQKFDTLMVQVADQDLSVKILGDSLYCERDDIVLYPSKPLESVEWIRPNGIRVEADSLLIPNATLGLAGTYQMIAQFKGSCRDTVSKKVLIQRSATPKITGESTYCQGQNIQLEAPTLEGYAYEWTYNDSIISQSNPLLYSSDDLEAGSHSFKVYIQPESGCGGFGVKEVTIKESAGLKLPTDKQACVGEAFETSIEGVKSAFWLGPNNFISTSADVSIPSFGLENEGYYSYIVETNSGCNIIDSILVEAVQPVIPEVRSTSLNCGSQVKLEGLGSDTVDYSWDYRGIEKTGAEAIYTLTSTEEDSVNVQAGYNGCVAEKVIVFTPTITRFDYTFEQKAETCDGLGNISMAKRPTDIKFNWLDLEGDSTTFNRSLPRGDYSLWVSKNDCDTVFTFSITKDCEAEKKPYLSGLIVDHCTNEPLKNMAISLYKADGSLVEQFLTDAAGRFQYEAAQTDSFYLVTNDSVAIYSTDASDIVISAFKSTPFLLSGDLSFEARYKPEIEPFLPPSASYCLAESAAFEIEGSGTYNWSGPNGFQSVGKKVVFSSLSLQDAGLYVVEREFGSCITKDSMRIDIIQSALRVETNSPICKGEELHIQSNEIIQLKYENELLEDSVFTFSNIAPGNHSFEVETDYTCFSDTILEVKVNAIEYELVDDVSDCEIDSYTLFVRGAEYLIWIGPSRFQSYDSSVTVDLVDSTMFGIYELKAITADGCEIFEEVGINNNLDCAANENEEGENGGGTDGNEEEENGSNGNEEKEENEEGENGGGTDGNGEEENGGNENEEEEENEQGGNGGGTDGNEEEENGGNGDEEEEENQEGGNGSGTDGNEEEENGGNENEDVLLVKMKPEAYQFCLPVRTEEVSYIRPLCNENLPITEVSVDVSGCIRMQGFTLTKQTQCYEVCYSGNSCDTFYIEFQPELLRPIAVEDSIMTNTGDDFIVSLIENDTIPNGFDSIQLIVDYLTSYKLLDDGKVKFEKLPCGMHQFEYILFSKGLQDTADIKIFEACSINVFNGISRNKDAVNDHFIIEGIESYPNNQVLIFNRQGHKVFSKIGYSNSEPWRGEFRDSNLPAGIYYYVIRLGTPENPVFSGYLILE